MKIIENMETPALLERPCAMTIGCFDGVHKGHQSLLSEMRHLVGSKGNICVFTFSNHPSHILPNWNPVDLILNKEAKLKWLSYFGVDCVYCIPFTIEIAKINYKNFIKNLFKACPFDHLVLGKDAHLGSGKKGTPLLVSLLCKTLNAEAHYLNKSVINQEVISSSRIRDLLFHYKIDEAINLLGHSL